MNIVTITVCDGRKVAGVIFEPRYLITPDGTIFVYWRNHKKWREQKKRINKNGYVRGSVNRKDVYIHRIVASCYVENLNNYKEVNHKDGNKRNNTFTNLEWCTRSQNNKHAFQTGLRDYAELSRMGKRGGIKRRKLTMEQARTIRGDWEHSETELAKVYGVSRSVIGAIRRGERYHEV